MLGVLLLCCRYSVFSAFWSDFPDLVFVFLAVYRVLRVGVFGPPGGEFRVLGFLLHGGFACLFASVGSCTGGLRFRVVVSCVTFMRFGCVWVLAAGLILVRVSMFILCFCNRSMGGSCSLCRAYCCLFCLGSSCVRMWFCVSCICVQIM